MGSFPKQDFIYGIGVGEERAQELDGEVYDFCEENGLSYGCGGNATRNYGSTGLVIGFELDSFKVVDEGYVGGYWVSKFNVDYFNQWLTDAREQMTPDVVAKIRQFLGVDDEPTFWTVSSFG